MSDQSLSWNAKHLALTTAYMVGATDIIHNVLPDNPVEVQSNLWLGSLHCGKRAYNAETFNTIINLSGYSYRRTLQGLIFGQVPAVELFEIPIEDEDITIVQKEYFQTIFSYCADIINDALMRGKKVLVHCSAGVNRAPTAICFYLIRFRGYRPDEAIELIMVVNGLREYPVLTNATFRMLIHEQK